jgi:hypothetical protein
MRRSAAGFAAMVRTVILLLGFGLTSAAAVTARELRQPWWDLLASPQRAVLDLLAQAAQPAAMPPLAPPHRSLATATHRHQGKRLVPLCGNEIDPNGHCL